MLGKLLRTIRKIMYAVAREQIPRDDSLHTVLYEIESIVNSRPITRIPGEYSDPKALTPNHLLLLKSNTNLPPVLDGSLNMSQYAKRDVGNKLSIRC